jgi:hypothetical protein
MASHSEKQFRNFTKTNLKEVHGVELRPQGNKEGIDTKKPVNMVVVQLKKEGEDKPKPFLFGGIRESHFDKVIKKLEIHVGSKHSTGCVELV